MINGSAWLMRSLAAISTRLPLRMNEAEFICDMIAPRGDQENLKPRGLFAHSSAAVVFPWISNFLLGGAREPRDTALGLPICRNMGTMGQ